MRKLLVSWLVMLFLCAAAVPLRAQQGTAEIAGKITDYQGAVLPGVAIVATNEATGVFREVTTGSAGTFFLSQLVPGPYRLVAKLPGFRTTDRTGLILQVGKTLTINQLTGRGESIRQGSSD